MERYLVVFIHPHFSVVLYYMILLSVQDCRDTLQ